MCLTFGEHRHPLCTISCLCTSSVCICMLGLLWAGSGTGEVWAAWLAEAVSVLPCHARSSAGLATASLPGYRGCRLGREFVCSGLEPAASYLHAVSTAVTTASPCAQGGRRGLSAVLEAQRPHILPKRLRHWSTSCRAELGSLIPLLCLCCRRSPHPHVRPDAAKHRSAWTCKLPLPLSQSVPCLTPPP